MSHLSCCLPSTTRVAPWRATPAHLVRSALRAWIEWRGQTVADRDLQSLDAYMLRDIGLSHRAAAGTAAGEPRHARGHRTDDAVARVELQP